LESCNFQMMDPPPVAAGDDVDKLKIKQ
jgi:hypothetical protein